MHQAHASLLLVLLVVTYNTNVSAAPIGAVGKLTASHVGIKHKASQQQNSLHQPGISSEYVYSATSGSSTIDPDSISTGASGSALSASISPDNTATQEPFDTAGTQDWYGDQCFEVKDEDVCLQEIVRRDCSRWNNGADDITDMWTSEFSCCREKGDYGEGDTAPGGLGWNRLWGSIKSMATCDWNAFYVPGIVVSTGVTRKGAAIATCYFGPETAQCGGPLCDRSMLSLQGSVHLIDAAYSFWGQTNANQDAGCIANWPNGRFAARQANATEDDAAKRAKLVRSKRGTLSVGLQAGRFRVNTAAGYHNGPTNQDVYVGQALVINGMITAVAGPRRDKFVEGAFEYVPYFELDTTAGANPVGAIDASKPWVRDNTLQITFYRHQDQYY